MWLVGTVLRREASRRPSMLSGGRRSPYNARVQRLFVSDRRSRLSTTKHPTGGQGIVQGCWCQVNESDVTFVTICRYSRRSTRYVRARTPRITHDRHQRTICQCRECNGRAGARAHLVPPAGNRQTLRTYARRHREFRLPPSAPQPAALVSPVLCNVASAILPSHLLLLLTSRCGAGTTGGRCRGRQLCKHAGRRPPSQCCGRHPATAPLPSRLFRHSSLHNSAARGGAVRVAAVPAVR